MDGLSLTAGQGAVLQRLLQLCEIHRFDE